MLRSAKRKLINFLLSHLFNAVTEDDALTRDKATGRLKYKGLLLEREDEQSLAIEANALRTLKLWTILLDSLKWEANKKMYLTSTSDDDIVAGKWMLYTIDLIEQKAKNLSNLKH